MCRLSRRITNNYYIFYAFAWGQADDYQIANLHFHLINAKNLCIGGIGMLTLWSLNRRHIPIIVGFGMFSSLFDQLKKITFL